MEFILTFQFQNGTIKSEITNGTNKTTPRFQFQNGTIKRPKTCMMHRKELTVSIPKWYD